MRSVLAAAWAELFHFEAVRGVPLVFTSDVVALFAFRARHRDFRANIA